MTTKEKQYSAEELSQFADQYDLKFSDNLSKMEFVEERRHLIEYEFAKEKQILPIAERDNQIQVAISTPHAHDLIEELRYRLQKEIEEVLVPREVLLEAIELCYRHRQDETKEFIRNLEQVESKEILFSNEEEYDLLGQKESSKVIKLLNLILLEALDQNASDIHFEPGPNGLSVRYRIDGVMQLRHQPPKELQQQLLTRIKVIAKLDIAEHRMPQDGRIKLMKGGKEIDFRVSTIPIVYGERIVLRVLDKSNVMLGLDEIGMEQELLTSFRSLIRQNQGIILVTGPTGSGKTTTLYSAISDICSSDINIMTIEDPVEYKLSQIAQIGVNPKIGLTFAKGLRHILRQDPDVILIGEIRDQETAEIAIQASLTGHLVLSTLHTNDAPSAVIRLIDMGIEPYLISSAVIGVIGQRLVRKICPECREKYQPTHEELIELEIDDLNTQLYRGQGCANCFHLGYKGREAIYELMELDSAIKQQLLVNPDATSLQQLAIKRNMKTMRTAGVARALAGKTTASEVLRVTRKTAI